MAKARAQVARRRSNPLSNYLRETIGELRKVTWPTRQEALRLTLLVLIVVVISSLFLGLVDLISARLIGFIISLG